MLPDSLRQYPQWLVSGEDKAPRSVRTGGHYADVRDKSLYVSFDEAAAYAGHFGFDVGFALTPEDPFTVIDLDAPENDYERHNANTILGLFDTYSELSRSGNGVHIWCYGTIPRGVRRDKVELYFAHRYMICTGRAVKDLPVKDCQEQLNQLYDAVARSSLETSELVEVDATLTDRQVYDRALLAVNGEKFDRLWQGHWYGEYPSQSEADFALMNMLCFYSKSNDQCRRVFRFSGLGQRDKAQRDKYLDYMISKIRAEAPPDVDFSALTKQVEEMTRNGTHPLNGTIGQSEFIGEEATPGITVQTLHVVPTEQERTNAVNVAIRGRIPYPPGFVGEIARYIHDSSVRPVREVGIAAALGLTAGLLARQFNISGIGLNQYLVLIAKTGVGKEGGSTGIERIVAEMKKSIPAVATFIGPGTFASGQGLIRALDEQHCFVSTLGEFGITLQMLSDPNVSGHLLVMRRVLLDLYMKSGKTSIVHSSAYSDREKNTKTLVGPALTIFGEATPETFYAGLSPAHIADGLIPRFLIIEYTGDRPDKNPNSLYPPPEQLTKRINNLAETSLRMMANGSFQEVQLSPEAAELLDKFDKDCDNHIRDGFEESLRQLWNRSHLKALRISALLASADRPHNPVVTEEEARWSIDIVYRDTLAISNRFESGDVGEGDAKQRIELERALREFIERDTKDIQRYGVNEAMKAARIVPYAYLQRRTANLSAFRKDRKGGRNALRDAVQEFIDSSILIEVPKQKAIDQFGNYGKMYFITGALP